MFLKECRNFNKFLLFVVILSFGLIFISCSGKAKEKHIARGEEYLQKRKFQEALMEFRVAVDIDSDSAEAHWGLVRSYENLGQFAETLEELRKVVGLAPDNLEAKVKLGNYLLTFEPPLIDEIDKILQDVFSRDPNFIEGYILKASLLSAQGKSEQEITDVFNRAISLNPNRTETYISLSRFLTKINKTVEAEAALKKGISVNSNAAVGYLEYGRFLTYDERFDDAEKQFLKAVEIEPQSIEARETAAKFYVAQKQFDRAEKFYKDLVQIEGNSPESRMALGNFYSSINRDDDAVAVYSNVLNDFPEYVRARYRLSDIYIERGETKKANEQIEKLFAINDSDSEALMLRVRAGLQENKTEAAVKDLEELLKKNPSQKDALFYMTQTQIELGRIEQARAFIGDLEKYHTKFLRAHLLKIQASLSAGESELALRQSNILIQLLKGARPDQENSEQSLSDLQIRALTARGLSNLQLGKIEIAQKDLNDVANYNPNSASAMVNLARIYVAERNFAEASSLYEKALTTDGENFDALSGLVDVLTRQRRFAEAQAKIDAVIQGNSEQNSDLAALHYLKSDVYAAEGNLQSAESELKKSIELDENYLPAYSSYATLLIKRNETDGALEQFKKVVERKPSAAVYTLIGILEDSNNNNSEAERNYRKALEIESDTPIAANNLAWLLATNKTNLDEALRLAQETVNQNPNNAGYYDTLGWVYYQKGLSSSAVEHLRKAVSLDAAEAARSGESPNSEYRQRLAMAINLANGKPTT